MTGPALPWNRRDSTRCGHWSALLALGVTIRAWPADQLDSFEIYRTQMPLQRKIKPATGDPLFSNQTYLADPEDNPQTPEPEPVKPRRALAR
jgi:hypothetical protein